MKIVSVGAVLMDQLASVDRFPGVDDEVFVPTMKLIPGGSAANFAVLCKRLGAETGFIGKVGNDSYGDDLVEDLEKEKVDFTGVVRSDLPTGTVFIAVRKDGQRMMFAHSGAANDLQATDINLDHLAEFDHLHLADLENISVLEHAAKNFQGSVSLNAGALIAEKRQEALELIKHVTILICSEEEAEKLTGTEGTEHCLRALYNMGPKVVIITRGSRDSVGFDGNESYEAEVFNVNVVDTTGAGDAFSAGFIVNYLETKDVKDSMLFGNAVASSVIQHKGARSGIESKEQTEELEDIPKI
jgi:sugar/nucleoside kinase (ribokinase family)